MTLVILFLVLVLLKFIVILVDSIVSQVHIEVIKVIIIRHLILLGTEPGQTPLMKIDS
jgi:hypothetical protein